MELSSTESVEVGQDKELTFPRGIPGFEDLTRYQLVHEAEEATPIVYGLRSLEEETVMLSVTTADALGVNYEITLSDEECELLELGDPADVAVLVVLYRARETDAQLDPAVDRGAIRAGFLSPLIINVSRRLGLQKVLNKVERRVTIQAS